MSLLLWALVGEGAAGAGAGGGGGEGTAAAYGGGRAAQPATRPYLGGQVEGGVAEDATAIVILVQVILVQLDDIDIGFSCAEGVGLAGEGLAAIGGLNEGVALIHPSPWFDGGCDGPLEVTIGI